jgi:hypothetical protein
VQSATNALESWVIQVLSSDDPSYNTICAKADWFDSQLDLSTRISTIDSRNKQGHIRWNYITFSSS